MNTFPPSAAGAAPTGGSSLTLEQLQSESTSDTERADLADQVISATATAVNTFLGAKADAQAALLTDPTNGLAAVKSAAAAGASSAASGAASAAAALAQVNDPTNGLAAIKTAVAAAAAAGAASKSVQLFRGTPPAGWTAVPGLAIPAGLAQFGQAYPLQWESAISGSTAFKVDDAGSLWLFVSSTVARATADGGLSYYAINSPFSTNYHAQAGARLKGGTKFGYFGQYYSSNTTAYNYTRIYDVSSNTWASGAVMPAARYGHIALPLSNGKARVLGGRTQYGTGNPPDYSVVEYDADTNAWATRAEVLPVGLFTFQSVAMGADKWVLFPSQQWNGSAWVSASTPYLYDAAAGTFTALDTYVAGVAFTRPMWRTSANKVFVLNGASSASLDIAAAPGSQWTTVVVSPPTSSTGTFSPSVFGTQNASPAATPAFPDGTALLGGTLASSGSVYWRFVRESVSADNVYIWAFKN